MLKKVYLIAALLFCYVTAFAAAGVVVVDSNRKPIKVYSGQSFMILLKSNPSTGYSWSLVGYDKNLVKLNSHNYVHPRSKMMGAPGQEQWIFTANSQKKTCGGSCAVNQVGHIRLKYARRFEKSKAPMTNFIVIVKSQR